MFWLNNFMYGFSNLSVFTTGKTAVICFMLLGFSNAIDVASHLAISY
jgi:hypothetical protein